MAKIRPQTNNVGQANIRAQQMQQNRQQALKTDVANAKTTNATTLGRQTNRTQDDKKTDAPKEKVTLTAPKEEGKVEAQKDESPKLQSQPEVKQQAPKEKTSEDLKTDFLNSFADNLDEKSASEIAQKTGSSMADLAQAGGSQTEAEPVLAAHTHNHAKSIINKKMPNASLAEIREAAKSDPEIAKALKLMDASSAYMKQVVKEKADGVDGSTEPGASAAAGAPGEGGASANVDPFAARRAGLQGQQPPGDDPGEPVQPSPDPGQPQSPYHLSPEKQAELMAQNNQTMQKISEIYAQMFADMQKAAAQRHQLMQETAIAISEIMMSLHARRAASAAKHHDLYLKILTDSWG